MRLLQSSYALCKLANLAGCLNQEKILAKKLAPKNGLSGRLANGAAPGAGITMQQGPKLLPPRINKPSS